MVDHFNYNYGWVTAATTGAGLTLTTRLGMQSRAFTGGPRLGKNKLTRQAGKYSG